MIDKGVRFTYLWFPAFLLRLVVVLGLALASTGGSVKAINVDSMLSPLKKVPELYPSYDSHITIAPSAPTPDDVIRITVSGKWFNVCVPRYQSHQVNGTMILYDTTSFMVATERLYLPVILHSH
jgi:hypothetical protein